jgi:hypothetical protein
MYLLVSYSSHSFVLPHGNSDKPVPSMLTSWSLRFASTFWMPESFCSDPEISAIHASQVMGTAKSVCKSVKLWNCT